MNNETINNNRLSVQWTLSHSLTASRMRSRNKLMLALGFLLSLKQFFEIYFFFGLFCFHYRMSLFFLRGGYLCVFVCGLLSWNSNEKCWDINRLNCIIRNFYLYQLYRQWGDVDCICFSLSCHDNKEISLVIVFFCYVCPPPHWDSVFFLSIPIKNAPKILWLYFHLRSGFKVEI